MLTESATASRLSEIQEIVRASSRLLPRGAGSKTAMQAAQADVTLLEVADLSGMLEYQAEEFTFTALAGTPLADIERRLAENGQYLPFDPPLVGRGATLGGTVAAGLSGPGRYRYGGVRDFILGVQFVDGRGELVRAGGKVVKNAAGFDLPKLMVGSLGGLGLMVELAFKVFPRPPAYTTLRCEYASLGEALEAVNRLGRLPLEIMALELEPSPSGAALYVRLGGIPEGFAHRLDRLRLILESGNQTQMDGQTELQFWNAQREFAWADVAWALVKIAVTPRNVPALDERLATHRAARRYSAGANLAWVAWPGALGTLDHILKEIRLPALTVLGPSGQARLGRQVGATFEARVRQALDPAGKWLVL